MAFEITPMKEDEIGVWNKVYWEAFALVEDNLSSLLYPGGFTECTQAFMRNNTRDSLSDPSFSYIFVRDSGTKEILAVACWYFQTEDMSMQEVSDKEEKARKERAEQEPIPGINFGVIAGFREAQAKSKREILAGKRHALLKVLATLPAAQRKGAGAAGLVWGLQRADELGMPAYLEASGMGRPLYVKHGFSEVSTIGQLEMRI
ncbi:unnamed protein product [Aureobasidium vineae]|uniref:N-acetyltransferase domain-containing protein n=1 Tax=Aureobasidium vineae TaxID=2773715 RepID=A0A9N8JQP3_9PEZI|nr:unnamed protein product [Aureobasidium vineae]